MANTTATSAKAKSGCDARNPYASRAIEGDVYKPEAMMNAPENKETVGLKECHACGAGQRERDKYCRQCGASQRLKIESLTGDTNWRACETRPLPCAKHYDSFSGVLVNLVAESVSARASSLSSSPGANRGTMRLTSALVAVPLWLTIVLLSPLDAYVAARAIARRM